MPQQTIVDPPITAPTHLTKPAILRETVSRSSPLGSTVEADHEVRGYHYRLDPWMSTWSGPRMRRGFSVRSSASSASGSTLACQCRRVDPHLWIIRLDHRPTRESFDGRAWRNWRIDGLGCGRTMNGSSIGILLRTLIAVSTCPSDSWSAPTAHNGCEFRESLHTWASWASLSA
jgi:hypothetical protein